MCGLSRAPSSGFIQLYDWHFYSLWANFRTSVKITIECSFMFEEELHTLWEVTHNSANCACMHANVCSDGQQGVRCLRYLKEKEDYKSSAALIVPGHVSIHRLKTQGGGEKEHTHTSGCVLDCCSVLFQTKSQDCSSHGFTTWIKGSCRRALTHAPLHEACRGQ